MAKKPSAAELNQQGTELAAQFAEMRKAQHNFALLISKDGLILKTHRRQPAETLWRKAKKEGGSNKGAKGICTMSGKVIEFQCDDVGSVPSTLAKLFKAYCAERNQPARGNFVEMTGEPEVDEEGADGENEEMETAVGGGVEEEEEIQMSSGGGGSPASENEESGGGSGGSENAEESARAGGAANADDLKTSLQREYEEITPKIEAAGESENKGFARKVGGLKTMFETQIEENPKKARAVLGLLQTTLQTGLDAGDFTVDASGGGASEGPDPAVLAERRNRIAELERGVDELLAQFAAG